MNITSFAIVLTGAVFCLTALCSSNTHHLKVGDKAPDFNLIDENGIAHTSDQLKNKKIALYFYPKDDTPGCTQQACGIRDSFDDLKEANIIVLGISKGNQKSHKKFSEKYHLPFPLLVATEKVLNDYGVNTGILRLWMPLRRTFLIDENGIIVAIITNVNVKNHAQQILETFTALK